MSSRETTASKWLSGANALLGLWLFLVPTFVWGVSGANYWNDLLIGAAIAILGAYGFYAATDEGVVPRWSSGLNALLGLWTIAAAFVWTLAGVAFWNAVVVGVLVAAFGGYNAYAGTKATEETTAPTA
ncbi:SPW repeat domain-containing protein [Halorussus aquaticus]|uniref:SPW repeat-containing integral membrane domain-containing protein n=1 Tax=Halorussus aquaticus TaxID=2953748 RepID=A0ABD5Q5T1_9EURY|nr:hypothetical protein [Halorussus aquaticus]